MPGLCTNISEERDEPAEYGPFPPAGPPTL